MYLNKYSIVYQSMYTHNVFHFISLPNKRLISTFKTTWGCSLVHFPLFFYPAQPFVLNWRISKQLSDTDLIFLILFLMFTLIGFHFNWKSDSRAEETVDGIPRWKIKDSLNLKLMMYQSAEWNEVAPRFFLSNTLRGSGKHQKLLKSKRS